MQQANKATVLQHSSLRLYAPWCCNVKVIIAGTAHHTLASAAHAWERKRQTREGRRLAQGMWDAKSLASSASRRQYPRRGRSHRVKTTSQPCTQAQWSVLLDESMLAFLNLIRSHSVTTVWPRRAHAKAFARNAGGRSLPCLTAA